LYQEKAIKLTSQLNQVKKSLIIEFVPIDI